MKSMENEIRSEIKASSQSFHIDAATGKFIERFREIYGDNLRGVIYYGSKLIEGLAKPSSFRDFFVIVEDWGPISKGVFDRCTLSLMPPKMWFTSVVIDSIKLESKYHVLTLAEFRRYCSQFAPDHYLLGRMSKRVGVVWASDDAARELILDILPDAFLNNAYRAAPLIEGPLSREETIKHFLSMSYRAELRLETGEKIEQLYRTSKEYYDKLYGMLIELFVKDDILSASNGMYRASAAHKRRAFLAKLYVIKSKSRHIMRFPFMIRNMGNWLEQLQGKYERTFNRPLEFTEFEKRHRIYAVLKYFYKIKIAGKE